MWQTLSFDLYLKTKTLGPTDEDDQLIMKVIYVSFVLKVFLGLRDI